MTFTLLKKTPPIISVPVFYFYITTYLLLRFLFASTYGSLFLVFFIYFLVNEYSSIKPYTAMQLMWWLDALSSEYKVAVISSFVTVVGFIVAFHSATINWKNQMKAQLKIQAADEIENFFSIVSSNITTMTLYVESLIDIVNKVQKGTSSEEESNFSISYNQKKASELIAARDTISKASVEVHRLISRNYNLLSTGWGLLNAVNIAAKSLSNVAGKMWVHIPIVDINDPKHIQSFVNQVNITECQDFLNTCEANEMKISGISGGIQGYLTAPIWELNFTMYANILTNRKNFREGIREFHEKINKN